MARKTTKNMTEQEFKETYRAIVDFENDIRRHIKFLIRNANKLYFDGSKAGLLENKKYEKMFYHLDNICFGENF